MNRCTFNRDVYTSDKERLQDAEHEFFKSMQNPLTAQYITYWAMHEKNHEELYKQEVQLKLAKIKELEQQTKKVNNANSNLNMDDPESRLLILQSSNLQQNIDLKLQIEKLQQDYEACAFGYFWNY